MNFQSMERPIGIAIIAWLHILGGVIGLFLVVIMLSKKASINMLASTMHISIAAVVFSMLGLMLLAIVSGILMWQGKNIGWYLGSFYYIYGVLRNVNALLTIPGILVAMDPADLAGMHRPPAYYLIKHGGRIFVHLLIYIYFFNNNVRNYFKVQGNNKWQIIAWQAGICFGISILMTVMK